jgi:hypothetical protein
MALDKVLITKLKRFAQAFKDARDREANESDTVMFLIKFFEDIMGYDSLAGEIAKEVVIKDKYCDFAVKIDGGVKFLVEAKAAGIKGGLREKDIEQAENYAAHSGIRWVVLTNGCDWQVYHLSFNEGEGITHDLAFELDITTILDRDPERAWTFFKLMSKEAMLNGEIDAFWTQKKALGPSSLIRVLFSEPVLSVLRRELNRNAEARLEMSDVFSAVKDVLSKDALMAAGDITMTKKRKKRRKVKKLDQTTGLIREVEEESDEDEDDIVDPPISVPPAASANPPKH